MTKAARLRDQLPTSLVLLLLFTFLFYLCNWSPSSGILSETSDLEVDVKRRYEHYQAAWQEHENHSILEARSEYDDEHTQEDWQAASGKGCMLLSLLEGNRVNVPQSLWAHLQLISYGWVRAEDYNTDATQRTVGEEIAKSKGSGGIGLPAGGGPPQVEVTWTHSSESTVTYTGLHGQSVHYLPTKAVYDNVYYPDHGVILASRSYSPDYMAYRPSRRSPWPDDAQIVPLKQWSDITYLEWAHTTASEAQRQNLHYVIRAQIINTQTKNVIWEALVESGVTTSPPRWPGLTIKADSEGGKALLGTPNGNGVAWLLLNHQDGLGLKTIESITIFDDLSEEDIRANKVFALPSMLFTIVGYTPPHQ